MKLRDFFRRKNYASPYYGGTGALFQGSAVPLRPEPETEKPKEPATIETPAPVRFTPTSAAPDWEQRRFELVSRLMCQERRSVILGKLQATPKQIAENARKLADASIAELVKHPYRGDYGTGKEPDGDGTE